MLHQTNSLLFNLNLLDLIESVEWEFTKRSIYIDVSDVVELTTTIIDSFLDKGYLGMSRAYVSIDVIKQYTQTLIGHYAEIPVLTLKVIIQFITDYIMRYLRNGEYVVVNYFINRNVLKCLLRSKHNDN